MRARGPIDPRLLREATASRWFLVAAALVGLVQAAATVAAAWFIASAVTGSLLALCGFAGAVVVRAATSWALDALAASGAARVKAQLRERVLDAVARRGPAWSAGRGRIDLTTVLGAGLDALDGYFARFLPQLVLTVTVVPVLGLALLKADAMSAILVALTMPVIPLFMVLVGLATRTVQQAQWRSLTRLSRGFLDVVEGMSTLTIFGRQHRQEARILSVSDDYRAATMRVLRVTFVSGFVLELAGSLATAVVAVTVGVRLIEGSVGLDTALFVLLLVPDLFAPVRRVGAEFHASADGMAAMDDVFEILEDAPPALPMAPAVSGTTVAVRGITVRYGERVVLDRVSAEFAPGRLTAIAGPSGVGKSSLVGAMLGFVPSEGEVLLDGAVIDRAAARARTAWAPQSPRLSAGSIESNVAMGPVDPQILARALHVSAADFLDPVLELGPGGSGVSGGQAQRIGIARAVYRALSRNCVLLVLDEPTSALDAATERDVIRGLRELAEAGLAVSVVTHRDAVLREADVVLRLDARESVTA